MGNQIVGARMIGLVRRVTVIINEIAAHPPDFAELFAVCAGEGRERRVLVRVDERVESRPLLTRTRDRRV